MTGNELLRAVVRGFGTRIGRWIAAGVIAGVLLLAGQGEAHAATPAEAEASCNQQAAAFRRTDTFAGLVYHAGACGNYPDYLYSNANHAGASTSCIPVNPTVDGRGHYCAPKWRCVISNPSNCASEGVIVAGYTEPACVAPDEYDFASHQCVNRREECLNRNDARPAQNAEIYTGPKCVNGCVYGQRPGQSGVADMGGGDVLFGSPGYTGDTCAAVSDPEPPVDDKKCVANPNGLTMCIKKNGDHCAEASSGRMICWTPGETGTKTDGNVVQKRTPGTEAPTPPTPPEGETLNNTNKPTTTTTTTPGGTTIITTINNWTTNNGTDGGPSNDGENDDGSDDDEDGTVGAGMGDPYEGGDDTVDSVLTSYRERVSNSNIAHAMDGFFTITLTGSCPSWTMEETEFNNAMTLDMCSPQFMDIWEFAGYMLLAIAVFCAFRIALY